MPANNTIANISIINPAIVPIAIGNAKPGLAM
jgi:hypothetical protein